VFLKRAIPLTLILLPTVFRLKAVLKPRALSRNCGTSRHPQVFGLRRQSIAATALLNVEKPSEMTCRPKSGAALRLPPQSMTRLDLPGAT